MEKASPPRVSPFTPKVRRWIVLASVALFIASLMVPAVASCKPGHAIDWIPGYVIGVFGWAGAIQLQFGWYANLFFIVYAVWLYLAAKPSLILTLFTGVNCALAFTALTWTVYLGNGADARICGHGPGYYLWLAAFALPPLSGLADLILQALTPRPAA